MGCDWHSSQIHSAVCSSWRSSYEEHGPLGAPPGEPLSSTCWRWTCKGSALLQCCRCPCLSCQQGLQPLLWGATGCWNQGMLCCCLGTALLRLRQEPARCHCRGCEGGKGEGRIPGAQVKLLGVSAKPLRFLKSSLPALDVLQSLGQAWPVGGLDDVWGSLGFVGQCLEVHIDVLKAFGVLQGNTRSRARVRGGCVLSSHPAGSAFGLMAKSLCRGPPAQQLRALPAMCLKEVSQTSPGSSHPCRRQCLAPTTLTTLTSPLKCSSQLLLPSGQVQN